MFDSLVTTFALLPKEAWAILGILTFITIISIKDWGIEGPEHRRQE